MYRFLLILFSIFLTFRAHSNCSVSDIEAIQNRLNTSNTIQFSFIENQTKVGKFYIRKPGMMRIDYDSPEKISIISNDRIITYYDHQLDEITKIKQDPKFLSFLSKKKIDFRKDFEAFACQSKDSLTYIKLSLDDEEKQEIILDLTFLKYDLNKVMISYGKRTKLVIDLQNVQYNPLLTIDKFNLKDKKFYNIE